MELELGLKMTRTREDVSSSVDFRFSKDPFGPLVLSRETDSRFIIIIHIKGFKKEGFEIEINEEGNRITIEGRKPVEEMVMIRWMAWRKEVEFRVFKKVFRIPDTVVLDEIKARFDDDDATLTITMPKRVNGISGFNIEEEEEERLDKAQVEEESIEREESAAQTHVLGEQQKDEEETGDHYVGNSDQSDEQDKVMERIEEEKELADSNKESEDNSSLRKHPDTEGRGSHQQKRHEEQENSQHSETEVQREEEFGDRESQVLGEEQKEEDDEQDKILERIKDEKELAESNLDSSLRKPPDVEGHEQTRHEEQDKKQKRVEAESKSDDFGSTAFEEQEPDEQLDRTSKSGAKEEKTTDDDGDGLRKVQDMVQGKGEEDEKTIVKAEIRNREDIEARMGTPNIDTRKVNGEDEVTETDEVDKIHELSEKNEEKATTAIRQTEEKSLIKLQEQHSKGKKPHCREHEKIKEPVEDKTPKADTDVRTNIRKPVKEILVPEVDTFGKTGNEGNEAKEKQNIVKKERNNGDAKEKIDAKMGQVFASNFADTAMKTEDLESDEELDNIENLVEKQEEKAKVGAQSDDVSLTKPTDFEGRDSHEQTHEESEATEIQREEEFGERESQVLGEEQKYIEETDHEDNLDMIHQIEEHEEEETIVADLNKENENSSLRKLPDIQERDPHDQTSHEEQERLVEEQQDSQAETRSNDFGRRAFEDQIEEQKPDVTKSREIEKKTIDDDDDDVGLSKVQEIKESDIHNEGSKKQEMVEGETSGHERKKIVKLDIKNKDAKEEFDGELGEGFRPNIVRTQVVAENDVGETETTAEEFESDKLKADEVHKIHELVEKKEDEDAKLRGKSKDISLVKLQENEEQQSSKGQKRQDKQEWVEEKTPKADTGNDISKPVQANTGDRAKEEKKGAKMEKKTGDAKEEVDAKMDGGFAPNMAETATNFEYDKLDPDEVDKIHKLVEKKEGEEENVKVGTRSEEDISSTKLQEIGEEEVKGQKRQEKIRELVEEQTLEAETNIGNDIPKPVAERSEEKKNQPEEYKEKIMEVVEMTNGAGARKKIQEIIIRKQELNEPARSEKESKTRELVKSKTNDEGSKEKKLAEKERKAAETTYIGNDILKPLQESSEDKHKIPEEKKNQPEEYKDKIKETGKMTNDAGARKLQELKNEPERSEKESKTQELVKNKRNDEETEEKETAETETRERESNRPKILREQEEKIQQLAEERTNFSKNGKAKEDIAENKTEFCGDDDDISSKFRQQDSDAMKEQEEIQELALEEKVSDGSKRIVAVLETKAENDKTKTEDTCGKQFQKLIVGEASGCGKVDDMKITDEEKGVRDSSRKGQETEKTDSELHNHREIYRNEDRPEKIEQELVNLNSQLEQDNVEDGEKTHQEPVEEGIKDCKEEEGCGESKTKTDDDVVRKVQGIKEHESYGPNREHVSKIQESEIEAECDSLRKIDVSKSQELHEPKVHKETEELHEAKLLKECDKTRIAEVEEPNGEEIVEPLTIRENGNFVDVPEINKDQPDKLQSQEKPYKVQQVVEAGLNDHKEEKVTAKAELETERQSSKKVEETEQQKYDGPKMQITEEKKKNIAVEEKGTKTKDGSLTKVLDNEDRGSSKLYKRQTEDKTQELVEMGTSDYREKAKKQDENDILRSQEDLDEFERDGEKSNIPQLVEEKEKVENIAKLGGEMDDGSSKRESLVKDEATDLKDKHTGGEDRNDYKQEQIIVKAELKTEEDSSKSVQETKKQECDELQRSMPQDNMQETEEKDKTRAVDENEIVERREKTINESLRKVREGEEDLQLGKQKRHGEKDSIQEKELNDHRGKVKKKDGDDVLRRSQETVKLDLGELDRHCKQRRYHKSVEDEQKGGGEGEHQEEERYEKVAQAKTKVEDEINKKVGQNKEPAPEKHELYSKLDKPVGVLLKEEASDHEKEEENLVDDSSTKIQETEKEELHELEKQDMVPDFVEEETGDQKDEEAEEAAALVASNANGSSRMVQTVEEESEVDMQIPEPSDRGTKEEVPKSRNVRDTKELEPHEGKTENCKEEKGKQGKIVETMSRSDDGIVRKIQETKVQESNEKKNQEQKGKIEETKRRESTSHDVVLVAKDGDSLSKGQELLEKESKRGPVKHEKFQQLKKVKSQDHVNEEANEKIAEERMQDKTDSRIKNQEIQGEEPYEFLRNGEHDKIPEYHRQEIKGMEQREIEETKRPAEECSSRKILKIKAQESFELEKHRKLSEIQEISNIQESVEKETQKDSEEEMNERGGYTAVLKKKSMASSESQDVEDKGSDQPMRYAEQELMTEKERKEENFIREREQKEKAKRIISQVASKANDNSLKKNHQELVEIETIDQRKERLEEENVVGKADTIDEYDSSRKSHEHEERKSDKLERHGEEEMNQKLAGHGTSDDKEVNRAGEVWEEMGTKFRADGFGKVRETEEQEKDKKQYDVEKDISGKSKENKNQETKGRDDSSGNKRQANEKQESYEQKRNEEDVNEKEETIEEHDSSRKIHEHDERKSDTLSENIAEEETSDGKEAKERNRAGGALGEVEKVREIEKHKQDKKQSFVDKSGKAKANKNQETKRTDDSSESHKKKIHHDPDKKNLGLLGKEPNCCRNEDDVKEDKEYAEAEVSRKLKNIEKRESTKMVETHENRDDIKELVEEKMNNKEGEDTKSMITEVLEKSEDHDQSKGLRKQDENSEERLRDDLKDKETSKAETKRNDNESRKIHQIKEEETNEQEILKEQGRIKELVEDRTHSCRGKENKENEFEDSKKIQRRDKEESTEADRNEKQDKIQEPVDRQTSEDDEEELEIEFEDEEEDWEAEVIQETDSDEENNKIRQIKRIRLGFRLVGGSTLFMSLIVIVISFIRSKRKIRCYKF